jgi:hypothetical protein
LLKNWETIKTQLGEEPWRRFDRWGGDDPSHFWTALCPIAADYPEARHDVLGFLKSNMDKMRDPKVLQFLEKVNPRGGLLRELCLSMLHARGDLGHYRGAMVAAEIIGNQFSRDNDLLEVLLKRCCQDHPDEALVWALAEGWPLEAEVRTAMNSYAVPGMKLLPLTYMYLTCTLDPPSKVLVMLQRLRDRFGRYYSSLPSIARPLIRRLRADDELAMELWKYLQKTDDSFARVSLPPVLAVARGLSPELREWCLNELTKQTKGSGRPEAAFDLLTATYRSMPAVLLDLLHAGAGAQ